MAIAPDDIVELLPPFSVPGVDQQPWFVVDRVDENGAIFVEGIEGGFDEKYLRKV